MPTMKVEPGKSSVFLKRSGVCEDYFIIRYVSFSFIPTKSSGGLSTFLIEISSAGRAFNFSPPKGLSPHAPHEGGRRILGNSLIFFIACLFWSCK